MANKQHQPNIERGLSTDRFFMSSVDMNTIVLPPLDPSCSELSANDQMLLDEIKSLPAHICAVSHILTSASILIADKYFQDNLKILAPLGNAELFRHRLAIVADLINHDYILSLSKNVDTQVRIINSTQKRFQASVTGWSKAVESMQRAYQLMEKQLSGQREEHLRLVQERERCKREADFYKEQLSRLKSDIACEESALVAIRQEIFRIQYQHAQQHQKSKPAKESDDDCTETTPPTPVPNPKKQKK